MDDAKLNNRALILFLMLFSAAILPFSGIALHEAISHGSERLKFVAMGFHNVAATIFTLSTLVHLKYNWKPILNYIKDKRDRLLKYPREMAIAGSTVVILILFSMLHVLHSHW
jgi:hypothetical protein